MKRLTWRPRAERDLEEVWQFTASRWDEDKADAFVRQLVDEVIAVASGRRVVLNANHIRAGYSRILVDSYSLYLIESADQVDVVRVLHQSRDVSGLLSQS